MFQKIEPLPAITSVQSFQSQTISGNSNSQPQSKINTKPAEQDIPISNNNNIFQKPQPIGIYNFSSNKTHISSLEQNIDEAVSAFIEQNRNNIIKTVAVEIVFNANILLNVFESFSLLSLFLDISRMATAPIPIIEKMM